MRRTKRGAGIKVGQPGRRIFGFVLREELFAVGLAATGYLRYNIPNRGPDISGWLRRLLARNNNQTSLE